VPSEQSVCTSDWGPGWSSCWWPLPTGVF